MIFTYTYHYFHQAAQHCFAADAAGAASGLGAIFCGRGVLPAVPVYTPASGAAESWALGIRPQCHAIYVDRWRDARLRENTKKRWTKGERSPHQEAERTT